MMKLSKLSRLAAALSATLIVAAVLSLADDGAPGAAGAQGEVAKESKAAGDLVPLNIKLPTPAFRGTPKHGGQRGCERGRRQAGDFKR